MTQNILLIDDHPMTIDSYINLLSQINICDNDLNFISANNCHEAYKKITVAKNIKQKIILAIIDVNLPPCVMYDIRSGVDLSVLIRNELPETKIVILTMHSEPLIVQKIIKTVDPDGLISKNDINFRTFPKIIENIIFEDKFYSKTILESQKDLLKVNVNWDVNDHQILVLLAEGVKNIDLPKFIPLSMSAIEKRKAKIKEHLLISKGTDKNLIDQAKKMGLI